MTIYSNITETIGRTPLLELVGLEKTLALQARIFAKLECFNPGGSVKDRAALSMIRAAEADGRLQPGGLIVEPTSGNTGIGLALAARALGYRTILTMPESMSLERRQLLKAYGAELVLTPAAQGMSGAVAKAKQIAESTLGAFMPNQFDNAANAKAHFETTGPEIWADMEGRIDAFVSGVGSGGTITGAGGYLKRCDPGIRIVAVEPDASPVLSGGKAGPHKIQGIGAGFVPGTLDTAVYHEVIRITNEEAADMARKVLDTDAVFVGISSGSALAAAVRLASRPEYAQARIAVVLPDTGERYISTGLFDR
jgi:cysteine synthase A